MLDYLQAGFWSLTYIFLIVYAVKFKMHGIPLVAICLNFAWETVALANSLIYIRSIGPLVVHIAWLSLDLIIVALYLFHEKNSPKKQKLIFVSGYIGSTLLLVLLFKCGYMLLSCFCIDLIMAIDFLLFLYSHRVCKHWISYLIAIAKLLGDMAAWLFYRNEPGINTIGILVLICNISYLVILLGKKGNEKGKSVHSTHRRK